MFGQERGSNKILCHFFCLTVPKISVGESFTVALFSGSGKVFGQEGEGSNKVFHRKFFVSQCRKTP